MGEGVGAGKVTKILSAMKNRSLAGRKVYRGEGRYEFSRGERYISWVFRELSTGREIN